MVGAGGRRFSAFCRSYATAGKKAADNKRAVERWNDLVTKELKGKTPESLVWKTPEVQTVTLFLLNCLGD